jgi:hypothetical protein
MKKILAVATLLLATGSTLPVLAVSLESRTTQLRNHQTFQSEGTLIADRFEEEFNDYRERRHVELERQMRQELTQSKYRYMSQQEKERLMKQAHDNLEDALEREERAWRRENEKRQDRYDDRYDNRYDRYDRYDNRNDNRFDSRFDNRFDNRYDNRNDNRYNDRYNYQRSRYNQRYNNR